MAKGNYVSIVPRARTDEGLWTSPIQARFQSGPCPGRQGTGPITVAVQFAPNVVCESATTKKGTPKDALVANAADEASPE
jgi:hypothetical protein